MNLKRFVKWALRVILRAGVFFFGLVLILLSLTLALPHGNYYKETIHVIINYSYSPWSIIVLLVCSILSDRISKAINEGIDCFITYYIDNKTELFITLQWVVIVITFLLTFFIAKYFNLSSSNQLEILFFITVIIMWVLTAALPLQVYVRKTGLGIGSLKCESGAKTIKKIIIGLFIVSLLLIPSYIFLRHGQLKVQIIICLSLLIGIMWIYLIPEFRATLRILKECSKEKQEEIKNDK